MWRVQHRNRMQLWSYRDIVMIYLWKYCKWSFKNEPHWNRLILQHFVGCKCRKCDVNVMQVLITSERLWGTNRRQVRRVMKEKDAGIDCTWRIGGVLWILDDWQRERVNRLDSRCFVRYTSSICHTCSCWAGCWSLEPYIHTVVTFRLLIRVCRAEASGFKCGDFLPLLVFY